MVEHRMAVEADLAGDLQRLRLGLHALELDAVLGLHHLDALQPAEEVEMPPGAAELAVGDRLQADRLLLRRRHRGWRDPRRRGARRRRSGPPRCAARASFSSGGRSRLPTSSARKGALLAMAEFPVTSSALTRRFRPHNGAAGGITQDAAASRGEICAIPNDARGRPAIRRSCRAARLAEEHARAAKARAGQRRACRRRASPRTAPRRSLNTISPSLTSLMRKRSHSNGRAGSMLACARLASTRSTKSPPRHSPSSRSRGVRKGRCAGGKASRKKQQARAEQRETHHLPSHARC